MQKFTKPFKGVPNGAIYPIEYAIGDECPEELIAGAESLGALSEAEDDDDDSNEKEAIQTQLEAAGIKFDKRWGLDKLRAALAEGKKD